jgi:hypothetical protein
VSREDRLQEGDRLKALREENSVYTLLLVSYCGREGSRECIVNNDSCYRLYHPMLGYGGSTGWTELYPVSF